MKQSTKYKCDPKLCGKSIHFFSACINDDEELYFNIQEEVEKFAEVGCGKCIVEIFRAVVEIYLTEEEKLAALDWLYNYSYVTVPSYVENEKDSIVDPICEMIQFNKNWDQTILYYGLERSNNYIKNV